MIHIPEKNSSKNRYLTIAFVAAVIVSVAAIGMSIFYNLNAKQATNDNKLSFNDAVGKKAPDFSLLSITGDTVRLSDYQGKNIVLFFNEGGMCYPSCWNQISGFGNDERFNNNDTVVFSIVVEPKSKWDGIVKQLPEFSNATILFDTTRAVSSQYDVLSLSSSMHKGSYPGHTYFIIDKQGVIRYVFDDPSMGLRNEMMFYELDKLG